jgi:hypothetical protein
LSSDKNEYMKCLVQQNIRLQILKSFPTTHNEILDKNTTSMILKQFFVELRTEPEAL